MFILIHSKKISQDAFVIGKDGPITEIYERAPFISIASETLSRHPLIRRENLSGYKRDLNGNIYTACKFLSQHKDEVGRRIPFVFVLGEHESPNCFDLILRYIPDGYELRDDEFCEIGKCLQDTQEKKSFFFLFVKLLKKLLFGFWRNK